MKISASEHFSGPITNLSKFGNVMEAHNEHDYDKLWFEFGGQLALLSISEWSLVTGLCYGAHNIHRNAKLETNRRLRDLYFDNDIRVNLKQFDENFEDLNFNDIDDFDALLNALYYFTDRVLNGRKNERKLNSSLLKNVDNLVYFRSLQWGYETTRLAPPGWVYLNS